MLDQTLPEVTSVPLLSPIGTWILVPTVLLDGPGTVTLDSAAATEAPSSDTDASSHGGGAGVLPPSEASGGGELMKMLLQIDLLLRNGQTLLCFARASGSAP